MVQAGLRQRIDQANFLLGADRSWFDLKAFARAFLVDFDMFGQILMVAILSDDFGRFEARDVVFAVAEFGQHFLVVLPEHRRRPVDLRGHGRI